MYVIITFYLSKSYYIQNTTLLVQKWTWILGIGREMLLIYVKFIRDTEQNLKHKFLDETLEGLKKIFLVKCLKKK